MMTSGRCAATSILLIGASLPFAAADSGLILNYTASEPVGLYRQSDSGRMAQLCLPEDAAKSAVAAGMNAGRGPCPAGIRPVLKEIYYASESMPIDFTAEGFSSNGRLIPNTVPKAVSAAGRSLHHFPFGHYTFGTWAISSYSKDSFDSRYFGPIDPKSIISHARPLLAWGGVYKNR